MVRRRCAVHAGNHAAAPGVSTPLEVYRPTASSAELAADYTRRPTVLSLPPAAHRPQHQPPVCRLPSGGQPAAESRVVRRWTTRHGRDYGRDDQLRGGAALTLSTPGKYSSAGEVPRRACGFGGSRTGLQETLDKSRRLVRQWTPDRSSDTGQTPQIIPGQTNRGLHSDQCGQNQKAEWHDGMDGQNGEIGLPESGPSPSVTDTKDIR